MRFGVFGAFLGVFGAFLGALNTFLGVFGAFLGALNTFLWGLQPLLRLWMIEAQYPLMQPEFQPNHR